MVEWFKIENDNFTAKNISVQFNIDTASNNFGYAKIASQNTQTIDITIEIEYNQRNNLYFFDLFENNLNYKFNISTSRFQASGCRIKSITSDPSTKSIVMDIISDFAKVKPIEERREEIIDEILDETLKNKNI